MSVGTALLLGALVLGLPALITGAFRWLMYPLAVAFEFRQPGESIFDRHTMVSVIIPAYNEEVVLAGCVDSILDCGWRRLELILVDDGSSDDTLAVMQQYAADPRVRVITKPNGGKGSALNAGIEQASGEVLIFADADGLFTPETLPRLLRGFRHDKVGAVCGNDQPVNLDRPLTKLLALLTHVGTGFTRRALAVIGALPIVAGNSGAFRADLVHRLGGFRTDTVGEDLELTWRVQLAGWDVEFAPDAVVLAEVPSTLLALWKQRVRWQRGLLQTLRVHRKVLRDWPRTVFAGYLPINLIANLATPVSQLLLLALLPVALVFGQWQWHGWLGLLAGLGLLSGIASALLALALDRAWDRLRFFYLLPLWPVFSIWMSTVTVRAIWLEATGKASQWNKLTRTGVRTEQVGAKPSMALANVQAADITQ